VFLREGALRLAVFGLPSRRVFNPSSAFPMEIKIICLIALALLVYLVVAVLRPEKF
jgi:K+-transporting ATPase KdpF subunit